MNIAYAKDKFSSDELVKFLFLTGKSLEIFPEIIKFKEVQKKAKELKIEVPEAELQEFADNFRISHGLFSVEDTRRFLNSFGLSEDDFETYCEATLQNEAIKNHLATEDKIRDFFVNNRAQLDRARISIIMVRDESLAAEIKMQVTDEGEDFHELARKVSVDGRTRYSGGHIGFVERRMFVPELSAKIFNADEGDIIGPIPMGNVYELILVEELIKAELTDETRELIRLKIYEEWASPFYKSGFEAAE